MRDKRRVDILYVVDEVTERISKDETKHLAFLDAEKTYHCVDRTFLCTVLGKTRMSKKIVRMLGIISESNNKA